MYRFAFRPRWLLAHLLVAALVAALVNLGFWQLRRLDERRAERSDLQRVELRGTFDATREVLVRFRSREGLAGYEVVTPLRTEAGPVVLVNRGWVPLRVGDRWPVSESRPPTGTVDVVGVTRERESGPRYRPARQGGRLVVGLVDTVRLEKELALELAREWVQLERPDDPGTFPTPLDPPGRGDGPHLTYALQWFAFSAIAGVGWVLLVRRSATARAKRRADPARVG